jgi:cbb3-type cytochrome oxidase subunit 3
LVNNAGFRGNLLFCFSCFYNLVSVWLLRKKKKKEEIADT